MTYPKLADMIQLTLSAVSKSTTEDSLISWPLVQNMLLREPPHTSLPSITLFNATTKHDGDLSSFYCDAQNQFHNITLPVWLARPFPLQTIQLTYFSPQVQNTITKRIHCPNLEPSTKLRPCQAAMPMGFKSSMFIVKSFASVCMQEAFSILKLSRLAPKVLGNLQLFLRGTLRFQLPFTPPCASHA